MSNRLVNNHCQQECTKDQKSAIVIFGQCQWALTRLGWKKDTGSPALPSRCRDPPHPHPLLLLALVSSLSSLLTIGKPAALPERATGSPQSACGLQTFFGRAGVAAEHPGPRGPSEAAMSPQAPLPTPCLPTSLPFLYCVAVFDRHRAYNNLFPAGTCTICLADPTNSFNPLSPCLVFAAVAHRHCLINAASYFIFTSCSLFDPPSPHPTSVNPPHLKLTASAGYLYHIWVAEGLKGCLFCGL